MASTAVQTEQLTAADHLVALHGQRRTRRFGLGMTLGEGPLAYVSQHAPIPLTPREEEYLIYAAAGVTGLNLGDMQYHRRASCEDGHGMALMNFQSRTVSSACGAQTTKLFYTNDEGVFFVSTAQMQDGAPTARVVQLQSTRLEIPRALPFMPSFNQWFTNRPGTTYFIPVTGLTELYINLLLVSLSEEYGYFFVDTDNGNASCGLDEFRQSRGGHLYDDPRARRTMTLRELDATIASLAIQEQGIMCQNIVLMQTALGLGGGMQNVGSGRHLLGMEPQICRGLGFEFVYPSRPLTRPNPCGLPGLWDGLVTPSTTSMDAAVETVFNAKFGPQGTYRNTMAQPWSDPELAVQIPPHSLQSVAAAKALCNYVLKTYGRFPAHADAFQVGMACQAHHLDTDFYDAFYPPTTLPHAHRTHLSTCQGLHAIATKEVR